MTRTVQDSQGIPAGIYVIDVDPDSPAMQAGIQSGDVITQVNAERSEAFFHTARCFWVQRQAARCGL